MGNIFADYNMLIAFVRTENDREFHRLCLKGRANRIQAKPARCRLELRKARKVKRHQTGTKRQRRS